MHISSHLTGCAMYAPSLLIVQFSPSTNAQSWDILSGFSEAQCSTIRAGVMPASTLESDWNSVKKEAEMWVISKNKTVLVVHRRSLATLHTVVQGSITAGLSIFVKNHNLSYDSTASSATMLTDSDVADWTGGAFLFYNMRSTSAFVRWMFSMTKYFYTNSNPK